MYGFSVVRNLTRQTGRLAGRRLNSTTASSSSSGWVRPVAEGVNPAYDEALRYLNQYSEDSFKKAAELEQKAQQASAEEAQSLLEKARKLKIEARINDPKLRWEFENGFATAQEDADAVKELERRKWKNHGGLDLLMQRITQMGVIPDLIPPFEPRINLGVKFGRKVVPGEYLMPSETVQQPTVDVQSFEASEGLYTLLMVDPDSPYSEENSFQEYCHWIVPNISIGAQTTIVDLSSPLLAYHPPHPSTLTPYHRYTFLLVKQPSKVSASAPSQRNGFNLREWLSENGYEDPSQSVVGANMFREGGKGFGKDLKELGKEKAEEANREKDVVRKIYEDVLGSEPPTFIKVPKEVRYPRSQ